jgi:hypothetical protein
LSATSDAGDEGRFQPLRPKNHPSAPPSRRGSTTFGLWSRLSRIDCRFSTGYSVATISGLAKQKNPVPKRPGELLGHGIVGNPTSPAYSAAKGAITTVTKSAALQNAKENIRINSVHRGYADTPLTQKRFSDPAARQVLLDRTPMGWLGNARDIANGPAVRRIILGDRLGTGHRWGHDGAVSAHLSLTRRRAARDGQPAAEVRKRLPAAGQPLSPASRPCQSPGLDKPPKWARSGSRRSSRDVF